MDTSRENSGLFGQKKYDIVVFGASGFTGQFVVEEVARTIDEHRLKWAVAGRDLRKVQAVVTTASKMTGKDLTGVPVIIADVNDESSLTAMSQQANLVINCVGPYSLYGTAVVKACVETGTNHIDISGEPLWIERTMLAYNKKAEEAGVYVLHACAFDSIPAEMGLVYTRKHFAGELNAVEVYDKIKFGSEGGSGNYGTWLSAVYGISQLDELKAVRRQLYLPRMPTTQHPLAKRFPAFYSSDVNSWCVPMPAADKSIVYSSEYFNWTHKKQKPVQFKQYYCLPNLWKLLSMVLFGFIFFLLSRFNFGIYLLKKYPSQCSFGMFSHNGPTRKQIAQASFSMTFVGNGYSSKTEDSEKPRTDLPNKRIVTRCTGPEPGYAATPICVVQVAYTLLEERDKLPKRGGVLTPGAAFAGTTLIDRLEVHGVHFTTVEK